MKNSELKELDLKEMQDITGGVFPFVALFVGFCVGVLVAGLFVGDTRVEVN
jgi:lactobin A/cerein 7B family class IIb bacteriocin